MHRSSIMSREPGKAAILAILFAYACAAPVAADEGMWPFDRFPKDAIHQKYNFEVTPQFLDGLRLASVRVGGGAGAFVSPRGLLLTDRLVVSGCLGQVGSSRRDSLHDDFFYAASESAEVRCPGLEAAVLTNIEDVTKQVKAAAKDGTPAQKALQGRAAEIARIERSCSAPAETCAVVTLFSGSRYDLYHYRTYNDVRLVFAPEYALAFFGAERDSITYLRYGLDIAFLRAYENGQPAATPHYLKWSTAGVKDGDLVFAVSDPGATMRATTAAQLTYYRDSALPVTLARLGPYIRQLTAFAAQSENDRRVAQPVLTSLLEEYKSDAGRLIGLRDDRLVLRKTVFDTKIREAVERDPALGKDGGKVWDQVATAYKTWAPFEKPYQILEGAPALGSNLFAIARHLVRGKPLATAESSINAALETILLTQYFEELKSLKAKDVPLKSILNGQTPQQTAEAIVQSTRLMHTSERRQLAANPDTVANSEDAMIRLALALDAPAKRLRKKREDVIGSLETSAAEKIAQYRYILFGETEYPDATSTPRVEFGTVKGYTDRAAVPQPFAATFGGLYYRQNNQGPYQVPQRWLDTKPALNLVTPLDFVSTCDIGGGEHGGPTVNRAGELVGIIFDGNLESLPNTYLYMDEQARAVHVAVQGIVQSLDKVYRAERLLRELGVTRSID
jgi:Peptidase S46